MAFCRFCGKELPANGICSCQAAQAPAQQAPAGFTPASAQGAPAQPQARPQGAPVQPQARPQGAPAQPQARPQGAPVQPQARPQGAPVQPQARPQGAPVQPQARPQGAPAQQAPVAQAAPAGFTPASAQAAPAQQAPAAQAAPAGFTPASAQTAPAQQAPTAQAAPAGFTPASAQAAPAQQAPAAQAAPAGFTPASAQAAPAGFTPASAQGAPAQQTAATPATTAATPAPVAKPAGSGIFNEILGVFTKFIKSPANLGGMAADGEIKTVPALVWGGVFLLAVFFGFQFIFLKGHFGFGSSFLYAIIAATSFAGLLAGEAALILLFGKNKEAGYIRILSTLCAATVPLSCLVLVMGLFSLIAIPFAFFFGFIFFGLLAIEISKTYKLFDVSGDSNRQFWFSLILIAVAALLQWFLVYEVVVAYVSGAVMSAFSSLW